MPATRNIQVLSLVATSLAALSVPATVLGAEALYVAGFGGSTQKAFEEQIIPGFEARTGAKVTYVPGNSTDTLAKLIAQKSKEDVSIAMLDDGQMSQAVEQNLCMPLPAFPMLNDIYPKARMSGGKAVGFGFYATGLGYNKGVFAKNGWATPTSWNDLGDPKYKGKVSIAPISSYGMMALVMIARANGGNEEKIEPGFEAMAKKVSPNVLAWEASPATMAQMFQTGEAALIVWGNTRVQPVVDQGAPVAFVYPKEGAVLGMVTACVINGGPKPKLAQRFLEEVLSPAAQVQLAKWAALGPTNSKAKLEPDVARNVVYGPDQVGALVPLDWSVINLKRPDWTKRWNREVER
ncbi:ABC transporter substrate-binding protein [Caballeronia sp. GACF5]|uniref:ABC transporter substrate-binding protein n=1 Tax=Caballeronia sp. GACF5 TaxID=2921746 RepID=UPI0020288AC8|nr:ABC transporter substrate-binding protein [Caballeronia sp. GACF5]